MKRSRLAETEKYAHVTCFLKGGIDTPFPGEDRILVLLVYVCGDKPLFSGGSLSDPAPTMLDILGVAQPEEITGPSLIAS